MRRPLSALLLLTLAAWEVACDPPTGEAGKPAAAPEAGKAAAKADAKAEASKAEASKLEESKTNVTGDRKALSECLAGCDAAKLSATDKATCRLNCESGMPAAPAVPAVDGGVGQALACVSGCYEDTKAEPKACVAGCVAAGAGVANAPAPAVLEQLGACVGECYADKTLKPTDRETCKLTCSQVAATAGPGDSKAAGK